MTDDELLARIDAMRRQKNGRWVFTIAELAIRLDPDVSKPIMDAITAGDRRMGFLDKQLIQDPGERFVTDQEILDAITEVRTANNGLWMRLVGIALEKAPEEARGILRDLINNDEKVSELATKLVG